MREDAIYSWCSDCSKTHTKLCNNGSQLSVEASIVLGHSDTDITVVVV